MSVPIGTIIAWYGNPLSAPNFYEFCDGTPLKLPEQEILAGYLVAANPKLFINKSVILKPNLQAAFLRGYDTGNAGSPTTGSLIHQFSDKDPNITLGEVQAGSTKLPNKSFTTNANGGHNHNVSVPMDITTADSFNKPAIALRKGLNPHQNVNAVTDVRGDHVHSIVSGGDLETRPRNISVSYLIKTTPNGEEKPLKAIVTNLVSANDASMAEAIKFLKQLISKGL